MKLSIALLALALTTAPAQAGPHVAPQGHVTFTSADGSSVTREQTVIDRSRVSVPTEAIEVTHYDPNDPNNPCGLGADGCSQPGQLYFARDHEGKTQRAITHEVGHQFDYQVMDNTARAEFVKILHDDQPWDAFPNSPHEQFAEAYSLCAIYGYATPPEFQPNLIIAGYGLQMTKRQQRRTCGVIRRAAIRFYG